MARFNTFIDNSVWAYFHLAHSVFIVCLFCAWNITTVEINFGVHLLKVKSAKCLCLLSVVLVLLFWSCSWSWSCRQRSWSWSCYFGLSLGLKNLVLFTSLFIVSCFFLILFVGKLAEMDSKSNSLQLNYNYKVNL